MIIKNATIVYSWGKINSNIIIEKESIKSLSSSPVDSQNADLIIDASNLITIPGIIDPHVHFNLPFCNTTTIDDFTSGSKAAIMGGVTTYIDFVTPEKGQSIKEAVELRYSQIEGKSFSDFALHSGITNWTSDTTQEIKWCINQGIPSFKIFTTYKKENRMLNDADIFKALKITAENGGLILVHAENDSVIEYLRNYYKSQNKIQAIYHSYSRPPFTENEAVSRTIKLTMGANGFLYIVHLSCGSSAVEVRKAREQGIQVCAETCPQYLIFDDSIFVTPNGYLYATCPPIRNEKEKNLLWKELKNYSIQAIGTDHCNFSYEQKQIWQGDFTKIPYGFAGVETSFYLIHTFGVMANRFSIEHLVKLMCENPAKIFGLYPKKGTILPGSDADLVIFEPDESWKIEVNNLHTPGDWNPYENFWVKGKIHYVIRRGELLVNKGEFIGTKTNGNFIKRYLSNNYNLLEI